jgi:hypothetical protein
MSGALGVGGGSFSWGLVLGLGVGQHSAGHLAVVVVIASVMGGLTLPPENGGHKGCEWHPRLRERWPGRRGGFMGGRTPPGVFAILLIGIGLQMLTTARRASEANDGQRSPSRLMPRDHHREERAAELHDVIRTCTLCPLGHAHAVQAAR